MALKKEIPMKIIPQFFVMLTVALYMVDADSPESKKDTRTAYEACVEESHGNKSKVDACMRRKGFTPSIRKKNQLVLHYQS